MRLLKTAVIKSFVHGNLRGHAGAVVTHSSPPSEVGGSNHEPYVGKLVVAF